MSNATIHAENDTPTATDNDIKRSDADTNHGRGDSVAQGIGFSPTEVRAEHAIQNSPRTWS